MKKFISSSISIITLYSLLSCEKNKDYSLPNASIHLEITDAPIDDPDVKGAYITLSGFNFDGSENLLEAPVSMDLLAYQKGHTKEIGDWPVPAGVYQSVNISLYLQEDALGQFPGCFVLTGDGKKSNLFGSSSLVKSIRIPIRDLEMNPGEQINLVIDFDLRKLVRYGNDGEVTYQFVNDQGLSNGIRVLVKEETGSIAGEFDISSVPQTDIYVYAYLKNTFLKNREIAGSETITPLFPSAVNSSKLDRQGNFVLAFLEKGEYELMFATNEKATDKIPLLLESTQTSGKLLQTISVEPGNQIQIIGKLRKPVNP